MKFTFKEILSRSEYLHKELIGLPLYEVGNHEDKFYDVKLLVNGKEYEPRWYNDIMTKLDKYIEFEAKKLVREKFDKVDDKARKLQEVIDDISNNLIEEYHLESEDYDD